MPKPSMHASLQSVYAKYNATPPLKTNYVRDLAVMQAAHPQGTPLGPPYAVQKGVRDVRRP